ncbi:MAG: alpha/beta hydrolase, partial [Specibacter sp.]
MTAGEQYVIRGVAMRDHWFSAPLDHANPAGPAITLYARELFDAARGGEDLPWLLFLQGGPGGRGNRPLGFSGWLAAASKSFRILMLD